jgi:hypothetical protein
LALFKFLVFLWCSPNTLIGLLLAPFYGYISGPVFRDWAVILNVRRAIGNPGAQTWGVLIYRVGPTEMSDRLFRHEREHVLQGMRYGIFFLLAYGIEFLIRYLRHPRSGWKRAYFNLSWEVSARNAERE